MPCLGVEGVRVDIQHFPSGDVRNYKVAVEGDTNAADEPIRFSGSKTQQLAYLVSLLALGDSLGIWRAASQPARHRPAAPPRPPHRHPTKGCLGPGGVAVHAQGPCKRTVC
ncbi:hypothetical protein ACWGKA_01285 [Streptomyces luteogriseus]